MVAASNANDFQSPIFFAEEDDVASDVSRTNTVAKIASIVTDARGFRS